MRTILEAVAGALFAALRLRASLVAENLLLRQQLAILRRVTPRPRLRPMDRAFWVVVSRMGSRWADSVAIVRPDSDRVASARLCPFLGMEVSARGSAPARAAAGER
jgi:hypothetical protein